MLSYSYRFFTDKKKCLEHWNAFAKFYDVWSNKKEGKKNKQEKRERKISKDIVKN